MNRGWKRNAAPRGLVSSRRGRAAFTLLEICIVLLILGILMGVMAPGMQSALNENNVRADARQLSLMVKSGMIQSADEHRTYVLDLSATNMSLAPLLPPKTSAPSDTPDAPTPDNPTQAWPLTSGNQLFLPDPKADGEWHPILTAQWVFRPGELCPATPIRFVRGEARLEMNFNPLTGNVENERSFFP